MVRRHVSHGSWRKQSLAFELAAVGEHLQEPRVVHRRAGRTGAAGIVLRGDGHVVQRDRFARGLVGRERLGEALDLLTRHVKRRVDDSERLEDALVEESAERCAGHGLDDATRDVRRHAVLPRGAGLVGEGDLREARELLLRRDALPVDVRLRVELLDARVRREAAVDQARGVTEQIVDLHRTLRRHRREAGLAGAVGRLDEDVELRELWQIHADRVRQANAALFDEHHRRDGCERLRHRVEAKDGVLRHRSARRGVELSNGLEVRDLSLPDDHRDCAGEALRLDLPRKRGCDAPETLLRQPDLLGTCRRERTRDEREQHEQESREDCSQSMHGRPPSMTTGSL